MKKIVIISDEPETPTAALTIALVKLFPECEIITVSKGTQNLGGTPCRNPMDTESEALFSIMTSNKT